MPIQLWVRLQVNNTKAFWLFDFFIFGVVCCWWFCCCWSFGLFWIEFRYRRFKYSLSRSDVCFNVGAIFPPPSPYWSTNPGGVSAANLYSNMPMSGHALQHHHHHHPGHVTSHLGSYPHYAWILGIELNWLIHVFHRRFFSSNFLDLIRIHLFHSFDLIGHQSILSSGSIMDLHSPPPSYLSVYIAFLTVDESGESASSFWYCFDYLFLFNRSIISLCSLVLCYLACKYYLFSFFWGK